MKNMEPFSRTQESIPPSNIKYGTDSTTKIDSNLFERHGIDFRIIIIDSNPYNPNDILDNVISNIR